MKTTFVTLSLIISSLCANAQSYTGFLTDNYSGVNSVIANPANITGTPVKTDVNIMGLSVFGGNDYYGVNILDAIKSDYDFDLSANKYPSANNNIGFNLDILGPSFMFNIDNKSSLAVFTRGRSILNVNEINGKTIDAINENDSDDYYINEGDFNIIGHGWAEVGVTYARELFNKDDHYLKGGLTLKYLQGAGSAYLSGKNLIVDYDADGTLLPDGDTTGSITSSGQITYGRFDEFDNEDYDFKLPKKSNGLGADLGFVYEWRPDYASYTTTTANGSSYVSKHENKYKLKLGLSITDIGKIKYKEGLQEVFDVTGVNVSEDAINNEEDINGILNNIYSLTSSKTGYKINLPTALHFTADWYFNKGFYVNLNTDLSLTSKKKTNVNHISNVVSLTPRFESKWFSFYLPVSAVQYNGFQVGAGLRAGPLYIGSGSVLSVLTSNNSKGADIYAGLKIPIYQGKPKDSDDDGIIDILDECPNEAGPLENNGCPWGDADEDSITDNLDECPNEAGPIENNGCPWGDRDGDGITDNLDECPDEAGPIENNGCPWGDRDGDGVLDNVDECPDEVGPIENNGCPWGDRDGDGVPDNLDKCPDVPGTIENDGCPEVEVTEEVQKTLNQYAKTILFNSGKSTIKAESFDMLGEIILILQEYPSAKFSIEGHTDSDGSAALNQNLSESRASEVMKYLIESGVASNRLTSKGYGESKPITSNATAAGKAINRRVEINLIKKDD